jgi:hypothetical protein
MEVQKALHQISEIHGHLARTDVYRGYRAIPVALSGVLGLAAAAMQTRIIGDGSPRSYVIYWVVTAAFASTAAGGGIVWSYVLEKSPLARGRTLTAVGQLLPSFFAGAGVTLAVTRLAPAFIAFLPGLWAVFFSLGTFASRPFLPKAIGWVALFYLVSGMVLLAMAGDGASLQPWGMGLTFGFGQIFSGIVLYWNLERNNGC